MDLIENVKHGLVFWLFGIMFFYIIANQVLALSGIGISMVNYFIYTIPFFLMGFFDKMLD